MTKTSSIVPWLTAAMFAVLTSVTHAADLPDFTELVEDNAPAVVNISTERRVERRRGDDIEEFFRRFRGPGGRGNYVPPRSLGSGFIISRDGYILTNNHVVDQADEILVRLNDRRQFVAQVIGADKRSDLALIKVDANDLPTVQMGDSENLKVGEWVLAIGSPFGFDYSVTAGIVSAKGRSLPTDQGENYVPFIQTDVAINPGNSGGPLFGLDGQVVGINSQIYSNSGGFMGVSFAIPIDVAMEVVEQLKETGRVSRGWLGVMIQEVNRDLAESFGLEKPHGALVSQVVDNSPAEAGGILAGDIIIAFNGREIERSSELPHYVGRALAGKEAELEIVREGKRIRLDVEIGELPDLDGRPVASRGGSAVAPSVIGLGVENLSDAHRERLGIDGGVRVVQSEGPAEDAGIRAGDVITRLNNTPVADTDDFGRVVESLPAGSLVPVLVIRGETPTFLPLRVPE
ncbi:MAG: DegQ family serine endoprotease [Pseudomonadales bacterium]|jgi:serine protease Do|nr:DegQ family serine endoprotease [Pseudomonadales bacterium]MDP6471677.1 DegQ family serine endoprotease [Pseudomonadales bacterium]MDP6970646.1 DegQ family serine endoprotease [Pseudomonadales bacterium]